MKIYIPIILILFLFFNCQIKTDKSLPSKNIKLDSSFCFTIKDATDSLDSKNCTLTRKYKNRTKTIKFEFTKNELKRIQMLYIEKDLDTLPNNYIPKCSINILPTFDEEFVISFDGKHKRFIYNSDFECLDKQSKKIVVNMKTFRDTIFNILNKKKELNDLESSDIIFL